MLMAQPSWEIDEHKELRLGNQDWEHGMAGFVCPVCSAIVRSQENHQRWHSENDIPVPRALWGQGAHWAGE